MLFLDWAPIFSYVGSNKGPAGVALSIASYIKGRAIGGFPYSQN